MDAVAQRLEFAVAATLETGRYTHQHFLGGLGANGIGEVEWKPDNSPVTQIDKGAERMLRERIESAFPNDGILGEEYPEKSGTFGYRWILDPIDGTRQFARMVPTYGVLVGLEHQPLTGSPHMVAGVCSAPAVRELMWAHKGGGTWWSRDVQDHESADAITRRAQRAHVSKLTDLSQAYAVTCTLKSWEKNGLGPHIERLRKATHRCQQGGFNCYDYVLLASGRFDIALDPVMKPWDLAALMPLVEEAGGIFTDLKGNPTVYGGHSLAANPVLHAQALKLMAV
jgi:histidinol-phosphatase